jgi:hypothetical protein
VRAKAGYRKNFIDVVDTIKLFGKVEGSGRRLMSEVDDLHTVQYDHILLCPR